MRAALALAPALVRERLREAHPRPLVGVRTRSGGFWYGRVSPARAWTFPYIQIESAGSSFAAICFDCDRPGALGKLGELPGFSWIVRNEVNGHAHVVWNLAAPVHRYPAARRAPLDFLRYVEEFLHEVLEGDPAYRNILTANPVAPPEGRVTIWGAPRPYGLGELAAVIPFRWKAPRVSQSGIGRNCDLFRDLTAWAGRPANADLSVLAAANVRNAEFDSPLPVAEVAATARSVERYRARWQAHGWHARRFIARQAARSARQKGKARKASASPEGSNEKLRPWEAENISRATWYRRQAARRETVPNTR